jgi:hypothetical protein
MELQLSQEEIDQLSGQRGRGRGVPGGGDFFARNLASSPAIARVSAT